MRISEWMAAEGLSYRKAAKRLGVSNASVVHKWATHRVIPSRAHMRRIVEGTDGKVRPSDFYVENVENGESEVME